jgi:hypothetical protein
MLMTARVPAGLPDRSEIDAATPADHKIGSARAEPAPVKLHLRPIAGANAN